MSDQENNFSITGDEARLLMAALMSSSVTAPAGATLQLYLRLSQISTVQPPSKEK